MRWRASSTSAQDRCAIRAAPTDVRVQLEGHPDENGNEFENVCDLTAFENNCPDSYRGVAALGISGRGFIRRGGSWYLGLDYTWLTHGRHVVVGTIGWQSR